MDALENLKQLMEVFRVAKENAIDQINEIEAELEKAKDELGD